MRARERLCVGSAVRGPLLRQVAVDVSFLQFFHLMDFSLLVGYSPPPAAGLDGEQTLGAEGEGG